MRLDRRTVLAGLTATAAAGPALSRAATQASDAAAMRRAATVFLAAIGPQSGASLAFAGDERTDWHWLPQRFYSRCEVVMLNAMYGAAREAALALLQASTTPGGVAKTKAILRLQEKLGRDAGDFQISVYGDPADAAAPWGWSLEGHVCH